MHPFISHAIAVSRQEDLLHEAAHERMVRAAGRDRADQKPDGEPRQAGRHRTVSRLATA